MSEEETSHVTSDVNTDVTCGPRYHGRSVRSNGAMSMLLQISVADKRVVSSWTFIRFQMISDLENPPEWRRTAPPGVGRRP